MKRLSMRLAAGSGVTFGVDDLACAAATHLGCWADEGLDVSWTPVRGGVAAVQAVLDGHVDASYGGLGPVLKFRSEGKPVRTIVSMARALAQNLVVQKRITSPQQLRGVSWALDGIGALSHHMARLIVQALGIPESEIKWQVAGPPPERIAQLLAMEVDVALLRVEEALALSLDPSTGLQTLLGFADLKEIVPVQPHGVLSVHSDYAVSHPEQLARMAKGMIIASRALNDDFEAFRAVYEHYVTVSVPLDQVKLIWEQERRTQGFAVDGEVSRSHWAKQMKSFYELNPELPKVSFDDVILPNFVEEALVTLGRRAVSN